MKKISKNKKAVSAVIGVILMVAITVVIATTVYVYVAGMVNSEEEQQMITNALENMNWDFMLLIPEEYTMSDVDVKYVSLKAYDDGWYRIPMELQSVDGPWTEDIWAWFNVDTEETHIQYR